MARREEVGVGGEVRYGSRDGKTELLQHQCATPCHAICRRPVGTVKNSENAEEAESEAGGQAPALQASTDGTVLPMIGSRL